MLGLVKRRPIPRVYTEAGRVVGHLSEGNGLWSTRLGWRARAPIASFARWRAMDVASELPALHRRGVEDYLRRARRVLPRCGEELGLVTPFSASGPTTRRQAPRSRKTGGRNSGANLLSLRSDIRCPLSVRVMSGKGKGGVGHRISPHRPQESQRPRGSRVKLFCAAGPRMGQSMQCGWPLRPILTWRWLVSRCRVISFRTAWAAQLSPQLQKSLERRGEWFW